MFANREDAGQQLSEKLMLYAGRKNVLILALPRGGVPVGFEVARALRAPLDVFIVRKIGVPGHEELAMGALASGGTVVRNDEVIRSLNISKKSFDLVCAREQREINRQEIEYRGTSGSKDVTGKTVILVDDGIATGATMQAAVAALRQRHPEEIVVAAPVAVPDVVYKFCAIADDVVCVVTPQDFQAVGAWYEDFGQASDEEVRQILDESSRLRPLPWPSIPNSIPNSIRDLD